MLYHSRPWRDGEVPCAAGAEHSRAQVWYVVESAQRGLEWTVMWPIELLGERAAGIQADGRAPYTRWSITSPQA
jgi:hypothetical protein